MENPLIAEIRFIMDNKALSVEDLAEKSSCKVSWVRAVLTGFTSNPGIQNVVLLHDAISDTPLEQRLEATR